MLKDQLQGVTDVLSSSTESLTSPSTPLSKRNYLWEFHKDALSAIAHRWLPFDAPRDVAILRQLAESHVLLFREKNGHWPDFQPRIGLTPEAAQFTTSHLMSSLSLDVLVSSDIKRRALAFQVWTAALDVFRDLAAVRESSPSYDGCQELLGCTVRLLTLSACGLDHRLFYAAWWAGGSHLNGTASALASPLSEGGEVDDDDPYLRALDGVPDDDGQAVNWGVRS